MARVLVLYASTHGHTAKIARRIADALRGAGVEPDVHFVEETGWTPATTTTFAGALQYREYDFFTRTLIRLMMKRGGHPTDTSQDYDYTDWDAVERFAREVAAG